MAAAEQKQTLGSTYSVGVPPSYVSSASAFVRLRATTTPPTTRQTPAFLRPRYHSADTSVPFQSKIVITCMC